jgi:hypothetical protein
LQQVIEEIPEENAEEEEQFDNIAESGEEEGEVSVAEEETPSPKKRAKVKKK